MQAVKIVFRSQVWHQLIFPEAVSTGHSIYNAYIIGDHVELKHNLTTFVSRGPPRPRYNGVAVYIKYEYDNKIIFLLLTMEMNSSTLY